MSTSLALAGLASGFDWQSFIDSIMQTEQAPITRLQTEQNTNKSKISAFDTLKTKISALQTSAQALSSAGLFSTTKATSSNASSTWSFGTTTDTPTGSYNIAVSRLATQTQIVGTSDIGAGIAATSDVTGVTLASMRTAGVVTAGVFTVNGAQVTIDTTDSLQDVFDKISTATSGAVTGSYDAGTDKVHLDSASPIVLGASNDTSNFLSVLKLANNGTGAIASSGTLGTIKQTSTLATAGLKTAITAVDGSGNGSFTINGVSISYNVNTDSLSNVITRINSSGAGVTAAYDSANDRMTLTNNNTGNLGVTVSESAGGFLGAVGISGGTTNYGVDAQYTINNGPTLTSSSNTLDASSHGIPGLSVSVNSTTSETITVASDTTSMKNAIQTFITNYNAVQQYISDQTKVSTSGTTVTTALMSDNREIQNWATTFRSDAFNAVSGVSGTIQRLENLGIDFDTGSNQLSIHDSTKLDTALLNHPNDVAAFFNTASTGFAARMTTFTNSILGNGTDNSGLLNAQRNTLTTSNTNIDNQIAVIQRQLDAERARLTTSFQAMESAQAQIKQMQQQLTSVFGNTGSTTA